jgi:hypothetical protein
MKAGEVNSTKVYTTKKETSRQILNDCYIISLYLPSLGILLSFLGPIGKQVYVTLE